MFKPTNDIFQKYDLTIQTKTIAPKPNEVIINECNNHKWDNEICITCGQIKEQQQYVDQRKFTFHKKPPIDKQIKDQLLFAEFQQKCVDLIPDNQIPNEVLSEVFKHMEYILKHSELKGTKLFKLYLFIMSQILRKARGKPIISKQISSITGISSLPDYNSRWLYQGHKLYQQFNFSFNPNILGNSLMSIKSPRDLHLWNQSLSNCKNPDNIIIDIRNHLIDQIPLVNMFNDQTVFWLFIVSNLITIQINVWILSTHSFNIQIKYILAIALSITQIPIKNELKKLTNQLDPGTNKQSEYLYGIVSFLGVTDIIEIQQDEGLICQRLKLQQKLLEQYKQAFIEMQ